MTSPNHYYVDPSLGSDTGDGLSPGSAWGRASGSVVQYALNQITQDGSDGDQINVKTGSDDTLGATLSFTTYGTPNFSSPLIIRGYTSTANDGGQGVINGAATYAITAAVRGVHFKDMKLHNCGSANVVSLEDYGMIENCEITNSTGHGVVAAGNNNFVSNNYIHDIGGSGVLVSSNQGHTISANFLANGTKSFSPAAIEINITNGAYVHHNIISISGATHGINHDGASAWGYNVEYNSILSVGASSSAVGISSSNTGINKIHSNLIKGFDSTGIGIDIGTYIDFWGHNAVHDCTTPYTVSPDTYIYTGDDTGNTAAANEILSGTPFAESGSATDFSNRFAYFEPVDEGDVLGGAYPTGSNLDKGAVQHSDTGGGTPFFVRISNSLIGR